MSFMKIGSWTDISGVLKKDEAEFGSNCFTVDHFAYAIWLDSKLMP